MSAIKLANHLKAYTKMNLCRYTFSSICFSYSELSRLCKSRLIRHRYIILQYQTYSINKIIFWFRRILLNKRLLKRRDLSSLKKSITQSNEKILFNEKNNKRKHRNAYGKGKSNK